MPLLFESRRMSTMPKKIDEELKALCVWSPTTSVSTPR